MKVRRTVHWLIAQRFALGSLGPFTGLLHLYRDNDAKMLVTTYRFNDGRSRNLHGRSVLRFFQNVSRFDCRVDVIDKAPKID
jgi:hypothetical protein